MNKEEKRELAVTVIGFSFLVLMMGGTLIYCLAQKEYLVLIALFAAIYVAFTAMKSTIVYYKERFKEIKQEKEKYKIT